jgi:hypothetical protein
MRNQPLLYNPMHQSIQSLLIDAFSMKVHVVDSAQNRRKSYMRHIKARILLVHLVSALSLILLATTALAQEVDPKYTFSKPSDEMDFTLPPLKAVPDGLQEKKEGEITENPSVTPPLYGFDSPPPALPTPTDGTTASDNDPIDQFFSTTTIIAPNDPAEEEKTDAVKEKEKPTKKKMVRRHIVPLDMYPAHEFKSVRLPSTIYHKNYSRDNRGLPFAYMEDDQQRFLADAAKKDDVDAARSMWRNGARLDWRDAKGTSLLAIAVQHHSVNVARWLLMKGVNPNNSDDAGLSPLHYAAYAGNHETVDLLLSFGADDQVTDMHGKTPLMYAKLHPTSNIVQRMLAF